MQRISQNHKLCCYLPVASDPGSGQDIPLKISDKRFNLPNILYKFYESSKEEGKNMEEIVKMVGNFGFPIAISAYLLVRIEGKLSELSASITELARALAVLEVKGEGRA
jgi:hypothetical protein